MLKEWVRVVISVVTVETTLILLIDDRNERNGLNQKQPGLVGGVNDRLFKPGRCGRSGIYGILDARNYDVRSGTDLFPYFNFSVIN